MPEGELGERTEKPTARKLTQARTKGQVPKSTDLGGAVMLLAATLMVAMGGWWIHEGFLAAMITLLDMSRFEGGVTTASLGPSFKFAMAQAAMIMVPILLAAFLVAYLSQVVQVGFLFTLKPIQPKLSNLSPLSGLKKIFGIRGQVKTITATAKLIVMVAVAVVAIKVRLSALAALPFLSARQALRVVAQMGVELALILVLLLIFIALFDYLYQRWQHTRDLMMTKQEIKDERRSMEGDPQLKGRRFKMYQEIVMQQITAAVPKADVIVNNPEHFSVAIAYDTEGLGAPRVVAKGVDFAAMRIRHVAALHDVPMVVRPPLARALYRGTEVGDEIAPEHYEAVAEILAYVYQIDQRAGRSERFANRTPQPAGV
ncbi:MAG: flagellar biosynthetic protein FlhB [Phycisphaeraceae bacterium]|nr:MAG: flagellar biosynthetic protein FlhB [Phycisphaeraceae bacterium]